MKTKTMLACTSFLLTGVIALVAGRARATDGLGVWEGSGAAYSAQGAALGAYTISLTRNQKGPNVRIDGKVTLGNGQVIPFWEEDANDGSTGFRIQSSHGSGHGGCFVNQICQMYKQAGDGRATATTVVVDSPDQIRLQETDYDKGQIVQFREATLKRKP